MGEGNTSSPPNTFIDQDSNENNIRKSEKNRTEREMTTKKYDCWSYSTSISASPNPNLIETLWNIVKTNVERRKPKN